MKKTIILLLFAVAISFCASAQKDSTAKRDSVAKSDTVVVPVYIIEVTDTVQVPTLLYKAGKDQVKYSSPGYVIRRGKAANNKGRLQYVEQPRIVGALDSRKRKVDPI